MVIVSLAWKIAPEVGEVIETAGGWLGALTVMETADEVVVALVLSVAIAVSE